MAEYIDKQEVLKILKKYGTSNGSALGHHSGAVDCAMDEIERLPGADVEPLRCEDCSHSSAYGWWCNYYSHTTYPNRFCSDAQRGK